MKKYSFLKEKFSFDPCYKIFSEEKNVANNFALG